MRNRIYLFCQIASIYSSNMLPLMIFHEKLKYFSNILIGLSMLFMKYVLDYIPTPVLDGLFLYLAVTALYGNQMFERITLFFTEQSAYPPNHYIRRVPQRYVHTFTLLQVGPQLISFQSLSSKIKGFFKILSRF